MKKTLITIGLVALFATSAAAITDGLGGKIYWGQKPGQTNGSDFNLNVLNIGTDWAAIGTATNFDNVNFIDENTYLWGWQYLYGNLEVIDPRDKGGTGTLMQPSIYVNDPWAPGYPSTTYTQGWHLVEVNPGGGQTQVSQGANSVYQGQSSTLPRHVLPVPENYVPGTTSNGLSYIKLNQDGLTHYYHDQNNDGDIDNTLADMTYFGYQVAYQQSLYDAEYSSADGAIYTTNSGNMGVSGGPTNHYVARMWFDSAGAKQTSVYFAMGGAGNPWGNYGDGKGLAVGAGSSAPIVYMFGRDNDIATNYLDSIFAFHDGDGDNVVSIGNPNDVVSIVWQRGDHGINRLHSADINMYSEDLEYYKDPSNGKEYLFGNGYSGYLFVLELADNGLKSVDGQYILGNNDQPRASWSGFELDMNPGAPIPEPGTMLLLGTGALGLLGVIRRRRMR